MKAFKLFDIKVLVVLKMISKFLDENPLSCCAQEISTLKTMLGSEVFIYLPIF